MQKRNLFSILVAIAILTLNAGPVVVSASPEAAPIPVNFTVDTEHGRAAISPYIYGSNQDLPGVTWTLRRFGGNRTTGFNWENNASNAGSDWQQSSDDYVCGWVGVSATDCNTPGSAISTYHNQSLQMGAMDILTLQMAGYAAKDKNGTVAESETAPSARWVPVVYAKGSAFANPPVTTDNAVYMDEEINYLVQKYGNASTVNGVKVYALDNEPALWSSTHPRLHPAQPTVNELLTKSVALARAVKAVDPNAMIFGPAAYGFNEMYSFQDAPDWPSLQGNYAWFMDYYLAQMKAASNASGKRLLDALDIHWYPEAEGGGQRIVFNGAGSVDTQKARVQAPRTLWDPTYHETSWIAEWFSSFLPLLPRLQQSIDTYYPGTKLAVTEFTYGGEGHISGGLAMSDVLGIFGKYGVYAGAFWQVESDSSYVASAYNLYRNYDGSNSKFGDTKIDTSNSNIVDSSMYASITGTDTSKIDIIVLNKNFDNPITGTFTIYSPVNYTSGQVWGFDSASSAITQRTAISNISGNTFTYTIPALTAYHIVLTSSSGPTKTPRPPTFTPTPTRTSTPTFTPSPTATPTLSRFTFKPVADTYVKASAPTTNYGSTTQLRVNTSPVVNSYLKFKIQGLHTPFVSVRLKLYANSSSTSGIRVYSVPNTSWTESTLTYKNAPPVGSLGGSLGSFTGGTWITVNLTSLITGNGTFSLAIKGVNSPVISLASRESSTYAPQLIITTR